MVYRGREGNSEKKDYVTIRGRLELPDMVAKAKVFYAMRIFREAVERAFILIKKGVDDKEIARRITRYVSNAHYSYSALQRAKMYREQYRLRLKKPQLYSIGKACEKGNRNIHLTSSDEALVKIPHADGKHEWVRCSVRFGKKHIPTIRELINAGFPYSCGIVLNNGKFYLHVTVPLEIMLKHDSHPKASAKSEYIAGFDLNSDRINMVITNENGEIIDIKNKHFPEITQHGYSKNKARDTILKSLNELINYAVHHNVKCFVFEELDNIKARKTRSRNANRKISRLPYRILLTYAKTTVKKRNGTFTTVPPAYASIDAIPLSKKLGLDIHTASAYLLAFRHLESTKIYQYL